MVIRKYFVLSLMAAGAALTGIGSPVAAKAPDGLLAPVPSSSGMPLSDGMISSIQDIELAPGEIIIDGPPELKALSGQHVLPPNAPTRMHGGAASNSACGPSCYTSCPPGYYVFAEALYMQRRGLEGFTRSTGIAFDDFDWEIAPRITWGRQFDCTDGYEFVFAGLLEWEEQVASNAPGLNTPMTTVAPLAAAVLAPFRNSDGQIQGIRASYNSFEFNRTYNGWDVIRAMIGVRTILYDEDYFFAAELAGDRGLLVNSTDNVLVGPQVGLDMLYPVSNRVDVGTRLKGSLMLNFAESDTRLFNTAFSPVLPVAGGAASDTDIAAMFEIGTSLRFQVTDSLAATIGYDIWFLTGVVESSSQLPINFTQTSGNSIDLGDDLFIHGLTAGVQFVY